MMSQAQVVHMTAPWSYHLGIVMPLFFVFAHVGASNTRPSAVAVRSRNGNDGPMAAAAPSKY